MDNQEQKAPMDFSFTLSDPDGDRKLYEILELSKERAEELQKETKIAFIKFEKSDKRGKYFSIVGMMQYLAGKCQTPAEVCISMYSIGRMLERLETRQPDLFGGLFGRGFGGIIIQDIRHAKPTDSDQIEGSEDDEINKLIRESYKINGKGKDKKEED